MAKTLFQINQLQDESPLGLYASFPTADAKLNFYDSTITTGTTAKKIVSPVKKQIFGSISGAFINFQTQALSSASHFDIVFPTSNTVGRFRRAGFTLIGTGKIKVLFSAESVTEAGLADGGTLLVNGGLPLGYINLECTNAAGYFKTAGSSTSIIEAAKIFRFGAGAGGGSGTGDANSFTENLKHRLTSSYFDYVTPVVFEIDEQVLTSSATASFDVVDGVYRFDNASEQITSVNMFDAEFLASEDDTQRIELHAEWFDSTSRDDNAVYQVSRDGGNNFQTVTMTRQGLSQKFTGTLEITAIGSSFPASQTTTGSLLELNATTVQSLSSAMVTTSKQRFFNHRVSLNKIGSPTGSYTVSICRNNGGIPGEVLYSKTDLCSSLVVGVNNIDFVDYSVIAPAGTYFLKIETDASYKSGFSTGVNSIRVVGGSSPVPASIAYNGTSWVTASIGMYYQLYGKPYDLRVKITSSSGSKKLKAFGIFYDEKVGAVSEGVLALQKFSFSGDLDTRTFNVTRFIPHPDHLKIYDIRTGQVFRSPAFDVAGRTITFPSGTFLAPGETVELIFDQSEGTGYDYSDMNANLMAANRLGSTDATVDRSVAGRGILLRNSNGQLRELWLDASDNLNITDPK